MARVICGVAAFLLAVPLLMAQRLQPPAPGAKISTTVRCAADLGRGDKSRRQFCDVMIAGEGPRSVVMAVPPHTGDVVLMFDLHNRFTVRDDTLDPALAFTRHTAVVAAVDQAGTVLDQAVVSREYRTVGDLFDRISGGGQGGLKAVAPGFAEAIRMTLPAPVSSVGLVGVRLEETTPAGAQVFSAPGRPVAMVSNFRLEYVPKSPE
ncbi:MAG: hypothetical protein R2752_00175 [Vicinamibacterales bacterium]